MLEINLTLEDKPQQAKVYKGRSILTRRDGDDFVIMMQHKMFKLNKYLSEIYDFCDGKASVAEIIKKVAEKHDLGQEQQAEIKKFIKTLCQMGILKI
ncbi:MAG: hypothetical protein US74_C0023G0010 [Parcubacteria group bacterium GW2011_GWA2_38_13]|nr:MAG: hypothetical protein US74_C0023G0010 [Parcubacteria group bacterium GW2011_GWA2_38_13]